jgi:positive regulator of sigma E activity
MLDSTLPEERTDGTALFSQIVFSSCAECHAESGKLQGLHSVSINIYCRITPELLIQMPVNAGDHSEVY